MKGPQGKARISPPLGPQTGQGQQPAACDPPSTASSPRIPPPTSHRPQDTQLTGLKLQGPSFGTLCHMGGLSSWCPGKVSFFPPYIFYFVVLFFNSIPQQLQSTPANQESSPGQFRGSSFWAWSSGPPSLSPSPLSPGLN